MSRKEIWRTIVSFVTILMSVSVVSSQPGTAMDTLAYWNFEQIKQLNGDIVRSLIGKPLTVNEHHPADPQPFVFDSSGRGNFLQARGTGPSSNVFSADVPAVLKEGKRNMRSLTIERDEYVVNFERPLAFYDMQRGWAIEASLKCNLLGTEQVFLCKEGANGASAADVSIGFDPMYKKYFVEVMGMDQIPHRLVGGPDVEPQKWYNIKATAHYDMESEETTLKLTVKVSSDADGETSSTLKFKGPALNRNAGMWILGRGFPGGSPNSLAVLDGGIDEICILGQGLPRRVGQNPIFTDAFTADPAALVVGDTVYVYVGEDCADIGGWFNMPHWRCYSSTDMKNWKSHGSVLGAKDFVGAYPSSSWAAQVVKKEEKYFFYVTLDGEDGHFITVAESGSPTGPFKEVNPGNPLVVDSMTRDSHRPNSDIDPTVFIEDDGTPWMAWGNGDCYMVKLKENMVELDGEIEKVPFRNFAEGPWLFKRGDLYYNVYAADAPGTQPEQICYATANSITGPWIYRGFVTGPAKHGFTIHPSIIEFKNHWYFFYHDGSYTQNGHPGGDTRRSVCVEYLHFNSDGSIRSIPLTTAGISLKPTIL